MASKAVYQLLSKINLVARSRPTILNINGISRHLHQSHLSNILKVDGIPVFIKTYGCQMNFNDTNIVASILEEHGYKITEDESKAEIYLLMTCAIRESAEARIWMKLLELKKLKEDNCHPLRQVGLLGCMAERLKDKVLEKSKLVDIVAGPDAYRDLARMFSINQLTQQKAVNCLLSFDETYSDITPVVRHNEVSSFISITRGCDNLCSYCIVPFTRGRERSRPFKTIVNESRELYSKGIKQVILLGQNVNSYLDTNTKPGDIGKPELSVKFQETVSTADGFNSLYKPKMGGLTFDVLLEEVAKVSPELRIRFTSPHPKDFTDEVIETIAKYPNIAKCIHLPAQSGSDVVLKKMRRGYTKEAYLNLVRKLRDVVPDIAITSDFISGFCGETEQDHLETLDLIEKVRYNFMYCFAYSMRDKTHAYHKYEDDVSKETKIRRLEEVINLFLKYASEENSKLVGSIQLVMVESVSKNSDNHWQGRIDSNVKTIIPKKELIDYSQSIETTRPIAIGDYVVCKIDSSTSHTLKASPLYITSMSKYHNQETNGVKFLEKSYV